MAEEAGGRGTSERVPTGVPGLDVVLDGGLLRGSCSLITGLPGTGKTVLAAQMAFHHVARGGRVAYVTLLTESHGRMLGNLRSLRFFDDRCIPDALYFVSAFAELEKGGLDGFLQLLRRLVRERGATMLVIDGLGGAWFMADTRIAFQRFVHGLYSLVSTLDCTTLLLSGAEESWGAASAMVESILCLSDHSVGLRAVRDLWVSKFRGSSHLPGRHVFTIDEQGFTVYPRMEALAARRMAGAPEGRERQTFGIPRFDAMLGGGVFAGSTTLMLGAPGSGKTLLGVSFLAAGARRDEPGLHYGLYESPDRLVGKADGIGLGLGELRERGAIEILWQLPVEAYVDRLAARLIEAVRRRKVERLFIDGLDAFRMAMAYPERVAAFFTGLAAELRALGVTTLISMETDIFPSNLTIATEGISAVVENIVVLRYVELRAHLHRMISILKMRESDYDSSLREFTIGERGIDLAETCESAEAILSGHAPSAREAPENKGGRGRRRGS